VSPLFAHRRNKSESVILGNGDLVQTLFRCGILLAHNPSTAVIPGPPQAEPGIQGFTRNVSLLPLECGFVLRTPRNDGVSNVEKNLRGDVDFRQARSSFP
jgi:hypothetical protein